MGRQRVSLLDGARIGLLEARLSSELADLVRREGGEAVCAPAVSEALVDARAMIPVLIDDLRRRRCELVVFLTGAGLTSLLEQALTIGLLDELLEAFRKSTTVCRGPKPAAVLRRHGVPIHVSARSPHTTAELLESLPDELVRGKGVVLLHDGGGNPPLVEALRERGAWVAEVRSYEWRLPDDLAPIQRLIDELVEGRIDAMAFTNQVQVRHLFEVSARLQRSAAVLYALRNRTIVGSIGPTCSVVLSEHGATPHVVASPPRMRPLITAVGECLARRRNPTSLQTHP